METDQIKFFVEECAGEEVDRIQEIEFSGVVEHAAVEEKLAGFFHGIVHFFHGFAAVDVQQQAGIFAVELIEDGK